MKKTITILSALVLTLSVFTACGEKASSSSSSEVSSVSSVASSAPASSSSSEVSSVSSVPVNNATAPEGLGDASIDTEVKISIDGTVYTFYGVTVEEFLNAGWQIDPGYVGTTLPSMTAGRINLLKDNSTITLSVSNLGQTALPAEQCEVEGIYFEVGERAGKFNLENLPVFLPGDFNAATVSPEEMVAAYGEPESLYPADKPIGLETSTVAYKNVNFVFFEGKISQIRINVKNR